MDAAAEIIEVCGRLGKFEKMKVARWLAGKKIRCLDSTSTPTVSESTSMP
jgi:hypothetical protein